nr:hypothetical protein [Tanacetum cinerariifolium]
MCQSLRLTPLSLELVRFLVCDFRLRFIMDDPNITMEEYIRLEEEKAQRHGRTFNWQSAIYGKIDSENENTKVDMPSPESTVIYFDDLDHFKYFETEFPAIVYNDAETSKLDFLTERNISPQHIDGFNLKDKTLISKFDEEEQNVLYVNDLFPLNVIYPDDLKSDKDNDDDEIQSSGDVAPLPPRDQRQPWLRYQVEGYTKDIMHNFEQRLETIFYSTYRTSDTEMGLDVVDTLYFQLGKARFRMTWRQFIMALGLHTAKEMAKDGFQAYWLRRLAPSYVYIRDPVRRLCHMMISCSICGSGQAPKK